MEKDFNYDDFTWDMVQSENKFFANHMAEKTKLEFSFLDDETIIGTLKWYDERNLGVLNEEKEEIYLDKRALKWIKLLKSDQEKVKNEE